MTLELELPIDVATRETLKFVAANVPSDSSGEEDRNPETAILEIGCGAGELASALQTAGYRVTAVDSDPSAVSKARSRGVSAVCAEWPDRTVLDGAVDAVLFTRSLHHVHDLAGAVRTARDALRPGGRILVEDFEYRAADSTTIQWFQRTVQNAAERGLLAEAAEGFAIRLMDAHDPEQAWREDHDHDLHEIEAMRRVLAAELPVSRTDDVEYMYRYLLPVMKPTDAAVAGALGILSEEAERADAGRGVRIGRRIVTERSPIPDA